MRIRSQKQLYLKPQSKAIKFSDELSKMSDLLESLPDYNALLDQVCQDLNPRSINSRRGRNGMTADQVLRGLILKTRKNYSYRELSESSFDSISGREFLNLSEFEKGFSPSTFNTNINMVSESTLDSLNTLLKKYSLDEGIETGEQIRTDATAIETNIHYPTDSNQLNDCIRVLSRLMTYSLEDCGVPIKFMNHYKASKSKMFKINNGRKSKKQRKLQMELIRLCRNTMRYAKDNLPIMESFECCDIMTGIRLDSIISDVKHYLPLVGQVIDVAHRRIVKGEEVSSGDKIFSIFEDHTDIIHKGSRDIVFGHKATITTGKSGLILDLIRHDGNPADSKQVEEVLKNHVDFYGNSPSKMAFDGCYSSGQNLDSLIEKGVENVCFSKDKKKNDTCSRSLKKSLIFFRAGIEASISMLKRMFGWTRVMNKGVENFDKTLKASVATYNLFLLSRMACSKST